MILAEMQKTKRCILRVEETTYEGMNLVDIRDYFLPEDGQEWLPTKRGVQVRRDKFPAFKDLIDEVAETLVTGRRRETAGTAKASKPKKQRRPARKTSAAWPGPERPRIAAASPAYDPDDPFTETPSALEKYARQR